MSVHCEADPSIAWELLARPDRWTEWSPHVAGAEGLGEPYVEAGSTGRVILRGGVAAPVEVHITGVDPGRRWSWKIGPVEMHHTVDPHPEGGCEIAISIDGPASIRGPVSLIYGPAVAVILRNLSRVAENQADERPTA